MSTKLKSMRQSWQYQMIHNLSLNLSTNHESRLPTQRSRQALQADCIPYTCIMFIFLILMPYIEFVWSIAMRLQ